MISPLAYVDPEAKLGKNVTVLPFAYIEKDVEIGDDCTTVSYTHLDVYKRQPLTYRTVFPWHKVCYLPKLPELV